MALLAIPILLPVATAALTLAWRDRPGERSAVVAIGMVVTALVDVLLLMRVRATGTMVLPIGGWPPPFGVVLVADALAAVLVASAGVVAAFVALYASGMRTDATTPRAHDVAFPALLAGINGALLAGDFFNLFVWFEVQLVATYFLLVDGGTRAQLEGAWKYVAMSALASLLLLTTAGVLYGLAGTLNLADLARSLPLAGRASQRVISMLLLVAFGIKAAMFPLFFWLPASYHTTRTPTMAILGGLMTKVGLYAMLRTFTLLAPRGDAVLALLLLALAGLTMVTGVLGALAQMDFRRVLTFHVVSQTGYPLMGLALMSPLALGGAVFFLAHIMLVKTALLLASGTAADLAGTSDLAKSGGLSKRAPLFAAAFFAGALSLAGVPPSTGFWAKLALVQAGLASGAYVIVVAALAVSALTLLSMVKIWNEAFWKQPPRPLMEGESAGLRTRLAAVLGLALVAAAIGLAPASLFELCMRAGEDLADPESYVATVLGGRP